MPPSRRLEDRNTKSEATVAEQASAFAKQQHEILSLAASLQEEASLQKMNAQLQLMKPAPRMAANYN